jgi:hypothetical protein
MPATDEPTTARPTIQAPPQLILDVGEVESALKQILDVLFQAAGLADSSI